MKNMTAHPHPQQSAETFYDFTPLSMRLSYSALNPAVNLDDVTAKIRTQIQERKHQNTNAADLLALEFRLTHFVKAARRKS
jgi:hypothetical protein